MLSSVPSKPLADAGPPDFSHRASLVEWMDEPCSYEDFRACLHDLAAVNRVTFAYRPTRIWLERLFARVGPRRFDEQPLQIVDVGCGQGDMLRYLARWARRISLPVRLFGVDLNPHAARAARENTSFDAHMEWVTGDAYSFKPAQGIDVVISSLFTHHLADEEVVRFLLWMEREARLGWFINDLHRAAAPYHLFQLLARLARWHRFVQHDGPVSIRRSFRREDWRRYLAEATLHESSVTIEEFRPARLCVGRFK